MILWCFSLMTFLSVMIIFWVFNSFRLYLCTNTVEYRNGLINLTKKNVFRVKITVIRSIRKQTGYRSILNQSQNDNTMRQKSTLMKIRTRFTCEHRGDIRLVLNLSEKGNYNPNLVWINKIQKQFLCALT